MTRHPPGFVRPRRSAFTLIEVLVVMGIIVLLVALALPAFNFITGSRSTEAASNRIAGALGVARAQAIGLQKLCGVMFFIEPTTDNIQLTLVQEIDRPLTPDVDATAVDVYLDLVGAEFIKLPVGVGVQTVTNALPTAPANRDRYIGFNSAGVASNGSAQTGINVKIGGVILFDANGQLVARTYALRSRNHNGAAASSNRMGTFLFTVPDLATAEAESMTHSPADYVPAATLATAPVSQLGLVLFDTSTFVTRFQTGPVTDPYGDLRANASANPQANEITEENWLDENGTPTMINRYNGTLVRGE